MDKSLKLHHYIGIFPAVVSSNPRVRRWAYINVKLLHYVLVTQYLEDFMLYNTRAKPVYYKA